MAQSSKLNAQFALNPAFARGKARAETYIRIGTELKQLRERVGLTQVQVAAKAGLDQADVSRLESGKWGNRISFDVLDRLLPVFGLGVSHEVYPLLGPTAADAGQLASAQVFTQLLDADV